MRYINLFIEYFVNMFVSICLVTMHKFWTLVTLYFITGNIGKTFNSEIGIRKNGRSNLFLLSYRILIYNVWTASIRLVD